jgi:NADH-quinone oxidoreductase subunit A
MNPLAAGPLWPLALYAAFVLLLAAGMIAVPYFLGQRHRTRAGDQPYESGMLPTGSARAPLTANYYLVALLFVIFDLEAVFLYAWAVSARQGGWAALGSVAVFIGVLLAALGYLWGVGALDWRKSEA